MSAPAAPPVFLISGRDPLRTSGGSESYVIAHARAAILAGYAPHVFSIAPRSEELVTDFGLLHRVASPVRPPRSITNMLQRPWLVPAVTDAADRLAPDVRCLLHAFGGWADTAAHAAQRLRDRGVDAVPLATVFTSVEHETAAKLDSMVVRETLRWRLYHRLELSFARRVSAPVEARALGRMRTVVVNYESVAKQLATFYTPGLPVRRLTYSPATAFDERPTSPGLPQPLQGFGDPAAPLIVSVSRHDGRKGLDTLLGALTLLRDEGPAFRACLVGPGVLLKAHRKLVRRIGLEDRILIPGRVEDPMAYLRAADVFVLPSRQEGSGSVSLLEALQAGVASVVSDVDGLPEDVTHEHDALLVHPGNRRTMAQAIRRLIEEPELRARLGDNGRRTFARRFAPEVFAEDLRALYTELGVPASGERAAERTASAM